VGGFIKDSTTLDIIAQLNFRFSVGLAISELTALQKEFQIFALGHDLRSSYELLGIKPLDHIQRRRWHSFLDNLKSYPSDRPNVDGHARIVAAYIENFQDANPLPVFTQCHSATVDPRVVITKGFPIIFSNEQHLIKSIPITPAATAAAAPAGTGSP
jgi:hypothetical protein